MRDKKVKVQKRAAVIQSRHRFRKLYKDLSSPRKTRRKIRNALRTRGFADVSLRAGSACRNGMVEENLMAIKATTSEERNLRNGQRKDAESKRGINKCVRALYPPE